MQNALNMLKKTAVSCIATVGFSTGALATNFGSSIDDQVTVTSVSGNGVTISTPASDNLTNNVLTVSNANANDNITTLIGELSSQARQQATTLTNANSFNSASVFTPAINHRSPLISGLIAKAKNFIGLPYRFGGTSPVSGFDCSGFMQYVYKQNADLDLPRTSQDMASAGRYVSRDQLQAGDMVFFRTGGGGISHVGMYIGDNQFIHAPRTGRSIEITNLNSGYWSKTFATARRVLSDNA